MAEITKVALKVDNNSSFPNNNTGAITPSILRAFNTNMIDSLVDEIGYNVDSASWNQQIDSLEAFTSSQQPSFTALNQFTASQLTINTGVNGFTQSADVRLDALESETQNLELFTASVNQIADNGIVQGTSTRLHFYGLVSASIVPNVNGAIASINIEQDGTKLNSSSFNSYTASTNSDLNAIHQTTQSLNNFTASLSTAFVSTASFNAYTQSINSYTSSNDAKVNSLINATASYATSAITASSLITASISGQTLTFTKGDSSTFGVIIPDISGSTIPAGTISGSSQITALGFVSSSITASSLVTASVSLNTITFTKGDGTTFPITVDTGSGGGGTINTGSFATTGSNTFFGPQFISGGYYGDYSSSNQPVALVVSGGIFPYGDNMFDIGSDEHSFNKIVVNGELKGSSLNTSGRGRTGTMGFADEFFPLNTLDSREIIGDGSGANTHMYYATSSADVNGLREFAYVPSGSPTTPDMNILSASFASTISGIVTGTGFATTGSNNFIGNQTISGSLIVSGSLTASLQEGYAWVGNSSNVSTLVATSSFGGGGGTTYINPTLNPYSGSLILVANTFTSSSFAHISASANGQVNLVFKNNNNTADTIISGSNNLFVNATAPTAGFKRYVGGSGNIMLNASNVPQISSSMAFSPTMNNNYFGGNSTALIMRGPVSSSTYTISGNILQGAVTIGSSAALNAEKAVAGFSMTGNSVNGTFSFIANRTLHKQTNQIQNNLMTATTLTAASSSIVYNNNIGGITVTNNASGGLVANVADTLYVVNNLFVGSSNTITATGSQDTGDAQGMSFLRQVEQNQILGASNGVNLPYAPTGSNSLNQTMIAGYNLGVTGSNASSFSGLTQNGGSAFFGRNNAQDGNRAQSAQTIFAIGTGDTTTRKTGFLIDSGSNTYVEGTLNVSGSTSLTGSLTIQSGSAFFANGNRQFNVGAFSSLVTQSGSAGVSQSVNFETTDISEGVSVVSNSRITLANSGTYSITFSAQLKEIGGTDSVYLWLKKNGTNVANTGTKTVVRNNDENIMTVEYIVQSSASDYYEIVFQNVNGHAQLYYEAASGNIPATPSIIITVKQVR